MVKISVLMPIYGRNELLKPTLKAYEGVKFPKNSFEVVVVCDEFNPELRTKIVERHYPYRLVFTELDHKGQSFASNRAAELAVGEYLLFTCHDIIPHPNLLREHMKMMSRQPEGSRTILMGYTPYIERLSYNPFVNYLINGGPQFAFHLFNDGDEVKGDYLYATNFFIKNSDFKATGGFDETFPYGCQDSEFGIRWCRSGGRIIFNKKAVGFHDHYMTLDDYCRKIENSGRATYRLHLKHSDYFAPKMEYFARRMYESFIIKDEASIRELKQRARVLNSPDLYTEILDYYFWKAYHSESSVNKAISMS